MRGLFLKGKIRFKTGKTIRIDSYDNGQLHGVSEKFIQLKKKRRMLAMEHYYQGVKSGVQVKYDNGDLIRADLRSRKKEGGVDYYFHFKKNKLNKITIVQASNRRELGKKALPELKIKEESYNEIQIEVLNYLSKNASLLSI